MLPRRHSTKRFAFADVTGEALRPDLPVAELAADWFAGRDAAREAIAPDRGIRAP